MFFNLQSTLLRIFVVMKHGARLTSGICLAVSVMLCLAASLYITARFVSPADAKRGRIVGSVESSPSSGPVGAIITVSGAGWSEADGTQVSFGYMIADNCSIVADSQVGTLSGGSFSGWFRWPVGTALAMYTVCAVIGSTTATANTYTLLSASAPQVSISPTTLTAGTQATIRGSNYFPAGTIVQLSWQSMSGSVDFSINPATSNSNGSISRTFTVPTTTLASGSYMIVAIVGGGHPSTLSSLATFAYNAPAPKPSPTPSPRPDPTPTQNLAPTATATVGTTPTGDSATPAVTQNTGQIPTSNTTGNTGGTTAINLQSRMVQIVAVAVSLVLLIAILATVLLTRRRKAHSRPATGREIPGTAPATNGLLSSQNGLGSNSALVNGKLFPVADGPISPIPSWSTLPGHNGSISSVPIGQMFPTNNGMPPMGKLSTQLSPAQMQYSPYIHLLHQSAGESAGAVANGSATAADDQTLEAIKRQVQMGLFAAPRQRQGGRPPS